MVKDFQLRNDTKLLLRNNPVEDLTALCSGKNVLFVYGGGSVKTNGCYKDVITAVEQSGGKIYEFGCASREFEQVERGIRLAKEHQIDLVIGAGGASIMDCAKLIAFGVYHTDELWEYVKMQKNPYGLEKLPLILMPTYPSSGSEYGLGAVTADKRTGEFGTAYGIPADMAILVPKYAMSLSAEMTAYTGAVTLVQLSAATIGDLNPVSYHMGISVIKDVLNAALTLKQKPDDLTAWGTIFYGASISTSGRLGLGKEENYAYDIYEVEFVPEILFDATYRKSLTTIFPRFLKAMSVYHEEHVKCYFYDAFGFDGSIENSVKKLIDLFTELGIDMYFDGDFTEDKISKIDIGSIFSENEIADILRDCLRTKKK